MERKKTTQTKKKHIHTFGQNHQQTLFCFRQFSFEYKLKRSGHANWHYNPRNEIHIKVIKGRILAQKPINKW